MTILPATAAVTDAARRSGGGQSSLKKSFTGGTVNRRARPTYMPARMRDLVQLRGRDAVTRIHDATSAIVMTAADWSAPALCWPAKRAYVLTASTHRAAQNPAGTANARERLRKPGA